MINSLIIALSMYSRIPMPRAEWKEESMRYVMCFFPLVGVVIGASVYGAGCMLFKLGAGSIMLAALMSVIPVIITGGIHLDGFIDTADALSSCADKEKRLEIMKDPHIGAFAVIWTAVYFVLSVGIWSMVEKSDLAVLAPGYVLSRALSGLAVVSFPVAGNSGLVHMFSNAAQKSFVRFVLMLWLAAAFGAAAVISIKYAVVMAASALLVFLWHYRNCRKNFGGITGDLAGCFLQVCELAVTAAVIMVP